MRTFACVLVAFVVGTFAPLVDAESISRSEIDRLAKPLVDSGWYAGVVVGVIDEDGPRVVSYGRKLATDPAPPGGDTFFEIGSISKAFTGVLLAEMVCRGEVALDDPVAKFFSEGVTVPRVGPRAITLADLATHTSGLPRLPDNLGSDGLDNPYAKYTMEDLHAFLTTCKPERPPGESYEYSNVGMGLLGHVLVRAAKAKDFESLLTERVLRPLGMSDTRIVLDDGAKRRLARGHDADGTPVANWDIPTLAGAGAIRSTANDMLKFVAANLRMEKSPLDEAIALAQTARAPLAPKSVHEIGLGWHMSWERHFIWHNGQTGGYSSFCGFVPKRRAGFVILASTSSGAGGLDQVGWAFANVLIGKPADSPSLRKAVKLAPDVLEKRIGHYVLPLLLDLTITREADRLFAQLPGQPKFGIYPESETEFFYKAVDAKIAFTLDKNGRGMIATLHQNGAKLPALRAEK